MARPARDELGTPLPTETPYALVDGTGVGYATPFYARFRRGAAVRQWRAHGKAVGVGDWQGGRVWLVGVALGQAYADEGKWFSEWVARYGRGGLAAGTPLVGDKLDEYRAQWLERLEQAGWSPVMRVEAGLPQQVRSLARLRAQARGEACSKLLRGRYRIERVFGRVKGAYGSDVEACL